MKDIDKLICEASGISSDSDQTLIALSGALGDKKLEDKQKVLSSMRKKIRKLHDTIDQIQIEFLNQGVSEDKINKAREGIVKEFNDSPQVIFWYVQMYNKRFFDLLPQPIIRVAICKELVRQSNKYHPGLEIPQIWNDIIANNGLVK